MEKKRVEARLEDNFDLAELKLEATASTGEFKVSEAATTFRRPFKTEFWMTNEKFQASFSIIEEERSGNVCIVKPSLRADLEREAKDAEIALVGNNYGELFLSAFKHPWSSGDEWGGTRLEALSVSKKKYVRMRPNMELNRYDIIVARGDFPEPEWPDESFEDILRKVFAGRVVGSMDHEIVKRLRGEIA